MLAETVGPELSQSLSPVTQGAASGAAGLGGSTLLHLPKMRGQRDGAILHVLQGGVQTLTKKYER